MRGMNTSHLYANLIFWRDSERRTTFCIIITVSRFAVVYSKNPLFPDTGAYRAEDEKILTYDMI